VSLLEEDLKKLHFPRMQFERAKQMIAAQYRIENVGSKRNRPGQLVRKGYFGDALALFEMTRPRSRDNRAILKRWQELMKDAPAGTPSESSGSRRGGGRKSGGGRRKSGPASEGRASSSRSRRRRRGPRKPGTSSGKGKAGGADAGS
jgi:hypothetical protein